MEGHLHAAQRICKGFLIRGVAFATVYLLRQCRPVEEHTVLAEEKLMCLHLAEGLGNLGQRAPPGVRVLSSTDSNPGL